MPSQIIDLRGDFVFLRTPIEQDGQADSTRVDVLLLARLAIML